MGTAEDDAAYNDYVQKAQSQIEDAAYNDYVKKAQAKIASPASANLTPEDNARLDSFTAAHPFSPQNLDSALQTAAGGFGDILNGMTLGWGGELVGGANALIDSGLNAVTGDNPNLTLGDFYNQRKQQFEDTRSQFNKENPITGSAVELAGALNNPIDLAGTFGEAATPAMRILQSAGTGALQGGVYGAGENDAARLWGLEHGAIAGAGVGGVAGALGEGLNSLAGTGENLQRASVGIQTRDVNQAAKTPPLANQVDSSGNPLVDAFNNLQQEGIFKGDKSPEAIQERLAARAVSGDPANPGLSEQLNTALAGADANLPKPPTQPIFTSTENYLKTLKGTDSQTANQIFTDEVAALQNTLDNGGTLQDWQAAKKSLQQNSKYGTATSSIENNIRTNMASDLKNHIDAQVGTLPTAQAGDINAINSKLREGLMLDPILERSKNAALGGNPINWLKSQFRTSGGFGVPMLLAAASGGGEYAHSGSIPRALAAGAAGAFAGSPRGEYMIGGVLKALPDFITPTLVTAAVAPPTIRLMARQSQIANMNANPTAPINYFKAGSKGVQAYQSLTDQDPGQLDKMYYDATQNFKSFAAPSGTVDPAKANKWLTLNKDALSSLPDLKAQLADPSKAQDLIDKHFQGDTPISFKDASLNALKEYTLMEPQDLVTGLLSSPKAISDISQTVSYLKSDREALTGLRNATLDYLSQNPDTYAQNRATLVKSNLFTASQLKSADLLFSNVTDPTDTSTLKAITQMANNSFLGGTNGNAFTKAVQPILTNIQPDEFKQKLQDAISNPLIARDLMNKANAGNISRSVQAIFGDEINQAFPNSNTQVTPAVPSQQKVTAKSSFPDPKDITSPPTGVATKTTLDLSKYNLETRARITQESGGQSTVVSSKGAQGLSQLMPATGQEMAAQVGEPYYPANPQMTDLQRQIADDQNIRLGDRYYNQQLQKYGNQTLAWAAYNAGPSVVDQAIRRAGSATDVQKVLAMLPKGVQKETVPYVKNVSEIMQRLGAG